MTRSLLLLLLLFGGWAQAQPSHPFTVEEAGQTNVFLDDEQAQVHVLLRPKSRLVFAFAAENSGIGLWFEGELAALPQSLKSLPSNGQYQEVEARFRVQKPTVLSNVLLDSIRTLRDESEGAPSAGKLEVAREAAGGGGKVSRRQLGGGKVEEAPAVVRYERLQRGVASEAGPFALEISPCRIDEQGRTLLLPGEVTMRARLPFAPMSRFSPQELYHPAYLADPYSKPERVRDSLRALEFLARREKMMAGSWRFLTYFGRDTLISMAMLEPILSDEALEAAIRSVLVRLSDDGMVAHEEDIGPWAEWRHLQSGEARGMDPVYDHKMIDDDLLLPVLLAKLKENGRGSVVDRLLRDEESRRRILLNADYVLSRLAPQELMRLNPGEATGDWRDSHEGLGGGVYPASVNADLALPALDALETIYASGDTPLTEKVTRVKALRPAWERLAKSYWLELSPEQVRQRLGKFAATLTPEQRRGFDKLLEARADLQDKPFRFPVLSFNDDMSPVVVPHTDVAFTLFYGHPDAPEVSDVLTLLERPFPYGLATPGGHLVASPVFSTNPEHYRSLGFGQYHGLVVWSWPSAMLQLGLLRQRERFPALAERIDLLLAGIEQSETNVGPLAISELWAIGLNAEGVTWRAYGTAGDQAESNALQLWSTVYPALVYARQQK